MNDQAERLRKLVRDSQNFKKNKTDQLKENDSKTRIIAVTSGKGGVGKTNFTLNLAISLNKLGYRCIVFDADIGFANIDVISGIIPKFTIADVLENNMKMKDVMIDGPAGVKLISGGSGINEIMQLDLQKIEYLLKEFESLENESDFILIDTGAGLSKTVLSFVNAADEVIVITTPEPTSLTDAYAMIKALHIFNDKVDLKVIINRVVNAKEANEVFQKLSKVSSKFLDVKINELGYVYDSKVVQDAVKNQVPFMEYNPTSLVSKKVNSIALKLIGEDEKQDQKGMGNFITNLRSVFTKGRF